MPAPSTPAAPLTVNVATFNLASASWPASVDPDSDPITYTLEVWDPATAAWLALLAGIATLDTDWVPPLAVRGQSGVKLRVKAVDSTALSSGWRESAEFSVPEQSVPGDLTVTQTTETTTFAWQSNGLDVEAEYYDGTFWRTLFAAQADESFEWDTSKRKGDDVVARFRTISGGDTSAWVLTDPFDLTGKYSGNIWSALLGYGMASLELLWKLNEASYVGGAYPLDSSGHGRDAVNATDLIPNQASIIHNRPADTSTRHTSGAGSGSAAVRFDATAWVQTIKTVLIFVYRDSISTNWGDGSWMAAVPNRLGFFNNVVVGANSVSFATQGGADQVLSADLSRDTTHMLVGTIGGGRNVGYIDGAVAVSRALATPVTGQDPSCVAVRASARNIMYQGFALLSEELDALQVAYLYEVSLNEPNDAPSEPGAFTSPLAADVFDLAVAVAHGVAVDPQADAIEYRYEYWDPNDSAWYEVRDWGSGMLASWDTSEIVQGSGFILRVRARDIYEEESDWRESGAFDIEHARTAPDAPYVEFLGAGDFFVAFAASEFASGHVGATVRAAHWRYATDEAMTAIIAEFTTYGPNSHLGINPRDIDAVTGGLQTVGQDADIWADVEYSDEVGVIGSRSDPARGRTAKVQYPGTRRILMRDHSSPGRHGEYGIISGTDGSSGMNNGAGGSGFRFPGERLIGAPAGLAGLYGDPVDSEQLQGLWRVASTDPSALGNPGRADGLKRTFVYNATDGVFCNTPTRAVYSVAPDFGILVRLFMPRPLEFPTRRYGVCNLGSTMRIFMQNQKLYLEGYHGFDLGFFNGAPCNNYPFLNAFGYDWRPRGGLYLGDVPIGEMVTLRLWMKATGAYPDGAAIAADEAGRCILHNSLTGLASDVGLINVAIESGVTWSWVSVGMCPPGTPNMSDGTNTFPGAVLELAAWRHPAITYSSSAKPWIGTKTDAVTPEEIMESAGLLYYYRLDDPSAPSEPSLVFDGRS